jgi:chromosome partitioning protein
MGKTIFIGARKGGVGKTMTAASLGVGLAREGKKTLVIDADSQHALTVRFGVKEPDKLPVTLATVMHHIINETDFDPKAGVIHHSDGVDLLPANSSLTGIELALAPLIGRETVLRQYIEKVKPLYDFILIDTSPLEHKPFASKNFGVMGMIKLSDPASAFTVSRSSGGAVSIKMKS